MTFKKISLSIAGLITSATYTMGASGKIATQNTHNAQQEIKKLQKGGLGLEISGETSSNFYAFKNKERSQNGGKGRGTHLSVDDSRINFEVFGKAVNTLGGLEYSYLIGMNGNTASGNNPVEENRLKFKGRWGTMMVGTHRGPTDFMAVGAFGTTGATGGVFGNYRAVLNHTTGAVIKDDLAVSYTPKDSNKITYVTPRAYGVQLGYAYTPDQTAKGEGKVKTITGSGDGVIKHKAQNVHEFGANFKKKFDNTFEFNTSATAMSGNVKRGTTDITKNRHDIKAYALGILVKYAGFSLGGEFLNNTKSGELKELGKVDAGKVYTVGLGYTKSVNTYSVSYMNTKRKLGTTGGSDLGAVKVNNYAVTYDRELLPGLAVYAEGVRFDMKSNKGTSALNAYYNADGRSKDDIVPSNKGHVMITGARIKF